jgi:hypothetical protein
MKPLEGPSMLEYIAFVDHCYFIALKIAAAFPIVVKVD